MDGEYFLCQNGGTVHILSFATGRVEGILGDNIEDQEEDTINSFALNQSNEEFLTHHKSGLFKLWNWKGEKNKTMIYYSLFILYSFSYLFFLNHRRS